MPSNTFDAIPSDVFDAIPRAVSAREEQRIKRYHADRDMQQEKKKVSHRRSVSQAYNIS